MKKLFSLLLNTCILFGACTDDVKDITQNSSTPLGVNVKVNPASRAIVYGTALPSGSSIGINVTAADGSDYDNKTNGYTNIAYTATGEGEKQEWNATTPILLSGAEGKLYAYYPYKEAVDYKAINVDVTEQKDWMYAKDDYTVSDAKANAEITLAHAQTAINVNLVRGTSYTGAGLVEALTVTSEGLADTGKLDARNGTFTSVTAANTAISIIKESFTLDGTIKSSQENPYMIIPASADTKNFTVTATLDGKTYSHEVSMAEPFAPGKVYKVNVTFNNTGLTVSTVSLVDWSETDLGETEFVPQIPVVTPSAPVIDATGKGNGVYIVTANGQLVDYTTVDPTAIGVVLVAGNHKFMIAKTDATDGTNKDFYWGKNLYQKDVAGLITNDNVDGTNTSGYLGGTSPSQLNKDYTTWTKGALAEFDGKANTAAIIAAYTEHNVSMDATDMCSVLGTFNASDAYNDWYVPALGQLALIYLNKTEINAALTNIDGTVFKYGNFWSSSEKSASRAWNVSFGNDNVFFFDKDGNNNVRFIRDIN